MVAIAVSMSIAALAMREVGAWSFVVPATGGVVALMVTPRIQATSVDRRWLVATVTGMSAFAFARVAFPAATIHVGTLGLVASLVAAVGEELLFRHAAYGLLQRFGAPVAIVVTAAVFGLVHAPLYGWIVVPVDVAAGLLFGWQRFTSGTWTSSAVTHCFANLIGVI